MSVEAFILLQMEQFYWDQNNLFSQNIESKSPSRSIKIVLPHYHAHMLSMFVWFEGLELSCQERGASYV